MLKAYLFFVVSGYGSSQRADHSKYYSLYSLNEYSGNEAHPSFHSPDHIGMQDVARGGDAWDARGSMETVGFEKPQPYNQQPYGSGPGTFPAPRRQASDATYPGAARTMSPAPTPYYNAYDDPYYSNGAVMGRPEPTLTHPGQ